MIMVHLLLALMDVGNGLNSWNTSVILMTVESDFQKTWVMAQFRQTHDQNAQCYKHFHLYIQCLSYTSQKNTQPMEFTVS